MKWRTAFWDLHFLPDESNWWAQPWMTGPTVVHSGVFEILFRNLEVPRTVKYAAVFMKKREKSTEWISYHAYNSYSFLTKNALGHNTRVDNAFLMRWAIFHLGQNARRSDAFHVTDAIDFHEMTSGTNPLLESSVLGLVRHINWDITGTIEVIKMDQGNGTRFLFDAILRTRLIAVKTGIFVQCYMLLSIPTELYALAHHMFSYHLHHSPIYKLYQYGLQSYVFQTVKWCFGNKSFRVFGSHGFQ